MRVHGPFGLLQVYVSVFTEDISAVAGSDYLGGNATLMWAGHDTSPKSVRVTVIGNDEPESTEAFALHLYNPSSGCSVGGKATVLVTISGHSTQDSSGAQVTLQMFLDASTIPVGSVERA